MSRASRRPKPSVITLADQARDARQWEIAAAHYREALQRNRNNSPIWVQLGHVLKASGRLAEAERAYFTALAYDRRAADPYVQLGHVLKIQGKKPEARTAYLRAFALDPSLRAPSYELTQLGWSEAHISELRSAFGTDIADPQERSRPRWQAGEFDHLPVTVPDLRELRGLNPRGGIAIVLHLYYPELWGEMRQAIERIPEPFDLFVSLTKGASDHMRDAIREAFSKAWVFVFENRGRDIRPFLAFVQSGVLFRYEIVCKLHTKRSPHIAESDRWRYRDGEAWRRGLIDGVLGSARKIELILSRFRSDPELGMIIADGNMFSEWKYWAATEMKLAELLPRAGILPELRSRSFPGGSIFWIRSILLHKLRIAVNNLDDFEPEPVSIDGGLCHAVERMFGLLCEDAGMRVVESTQITK